jgi:hypothetical protein
VPFLEAVPGPCRLPPLARETVECRLRELDVDERLSQGSCSDKSSNLCSSLTQEVLARYDSERKSVA